MPQSIIPDLYTRLRDKYCKEVLSRIETASVLGISTKTLDRARNTDNSPAHIMVGNSIRYPLLEIVYFLQKNKTSLG